ncbi:DUF5316 domain-containing protein [Gottfriedia solisilvae]|uniref:DUF5316 domain-containing protein n=1 Tax=Gottfriedia solisilvae TaxID=1516104 RepID=A0A8J3AQU6_9BACI|nr:DUF5316 domain-containing protein [Gottfriedia solisilvae]GGI18059.1 hypothetical protein GCM10007380_41040 [Gottfriedia solisilvae]
MKYFYLGIILSIIGVLISLFIVGINNASLITGVIGVVFIGLSMLFSGSMVSGDQMRANFSTESKEDRRERLVSTKRLALIGLPNIIVSLLFYWLYN